VTATARNETAEQVDLESVSSLVDGVLAAEDGEGEVSIVLVEPAAIRRLNRQYRGRDSVTDVLAFPIDEDPADDLPGVPRMLGDVVVCLEQARVQAVELGHSPAEELTTLLAHGTLHLLGYDHEDDADEGRMAQRQDELLGRLPSVAWAA
jgi:probable rRNA maturation factor